LVESIEYAHDQNIWSLDWHPIGHILVSGSNDHSTRFWTRTRPGDTSQEKFQVNRPKIEENISKEAAIEDGKKFLVSSFKNFNAMINNSLPLSFIYRIKNARCTII
jgi:WD40 repeat protein